MCEARNNKIPVNIRYENGETAIALVEETSGLIEILNQHSLPDDSAVWISDDLILSGSSGRHGSRYQITNIREGDVLIVAGFEWGSPDYIISDGCVRLGAGLASVAFYPVPCFNGSRKLQLTLQSNDNSPISISDAYTISAKIKNNSSESLRLPPASVSTWYICKKDRDEMEDSTSKDKTLQHTIFVSMVPGCLMKRDFFVNGYLDLAPGEEKEIQLKESYFSRNIGDRKNIHIAVEYPFGEDCYRGTIISNSVEGIVSEGAVGP